MSAHSSPLPPVHTLPHAIRSAERLRGSLVPCGPGLRGVGWPDVPSVRAAVFSQCCSPGLAAVLSTAAWVWGALRSPPCPMDVACSRGGSAAERFNPALRVRDLRFQRGELYAFGAVQVSTPLRTVSDMLRLIERFGVPERAACRLLLQLAPGGAQSLARDLAARPIPYRRRALERLESVSPTRR